MSDDRKLPHGVIIDRNPPSPPSGEDQERLFQSLITNGCSCKSKLGFFSGPRGGANQNVMCRNKFCRLEYVVMVMKPGVGIATQSGQADLDRFGFFARYHPDKWDASKPTTMFGAVFIR